MRLLFLLAFVAAMAAPLGAGATSLSDLWWNPAQSGWGANIVEQDDTAVVTLFVHGTDGEPTWLIGVASRYATSPGGFPQFSGPLFRTRGPYYGGVFDPSQTQETVVGSIWLTSNGENALTIEYIVNGLTVVKDVVRQTWRQPQPANFYSVYFRLSQVLPAAPPYGKLEYQADVMIMFDGDNASLDVAWPDGHCLYLGQRQQYGRYGKLTGTFSCGGGDIGTFEITGLEFTTHGVTGYLRTTRANRIEFGPFGGVGL